MQYPETCCGFGGTFAVKFEPVSTGMADSKVVDAVQTGAEYIVSTDYSCLMHLQAYIEKQQHPIKVLHIADLLAMSIA
jgi:L-lactate dehydrogenase complex protein LldE